MRALLCGFALVVASFLAATLFTHHATSQIDAASDAIAYDTAPSIQHLAAVRVEARQMASLVERELRLPFLSVSGRERTQLEWSMASLDLEVTAYLVLPLSEGERSLWAEVRVRSAAFQSAVRRVLALADAGARDAARDAIAGEVYPAEARLLDSANRAIELNAESGRRQAIRIKYVRHRALRLGIALDILCAMLAALAGVHVWREGRRRVAALVAKAQLHQDRARELELFAGRVAHDIANPVGAAAMAVDLALREQATQPKKREVLARAKSSLSRAERILGGLLRFAQAGARPHPGAVANVAAVIEDVLSGVSVDVLHANVEVISELSPCTAACDVGVLTSVVSNLIVNAIKYLGEGPVRRIEVRARPKGGLVRIEVEDTGPGLPPELVERVFDPYVRGERQDKPGLGLGLATVKRLVEGHRGRLGVETMPGRGCLFWFELPAARHHREQPLRSAGGKRV
ncbi:MAG TPA: HAMP domain-containing sensor histidine kinase [Anaeromyxobacteraceae bacterium]|nr:HAMP domain-containing sensor histidine kinase [Anaeromyxobacteraceae bacterium]